jgi:hypothetical protein
MPVNDRGGTGTIDSMHFKRMTNHFEILFKEKALSKYTAGFSAGILFEKDRYNTGIVPDTIIKRIREFPSAGWGGDSVSLPFVTGWETVIYTRGTKEYLNTAITGSFFNHTGKYLNWDINARQYITGYKSGDMSIDGSVQIHYFTSKGRSSLVLGGSVDNVKPGYFMNSYISNLIAWDNDFKYSQEIRLRGEFLVPHRRLKLGAYLSQLNNYVYFNEYAQPEQTSEPLATGTVYLEKDIHWWMFGFRFRMYGQYSSNDKIIPLPLFAGTQTTYFEWKLFRNMATAKYSLKNDAFTKIMTMHIGWDIVYNTKYYAYAYMPCNGMFHIQDGQKIGNYPFFDFFMNIQINRARIFIKTDGLNTMFSERLGRYNYMAYRYPTSNFRLKFGVSWLFYD